jgi:hypothetical protein
VRVEERGSIGEGEWLPLMFFIILCRVVHLSRGHRVINRVSPMTVGRLCVLECEYVWSRKLELEYVYSNVNMSSFLGRGRSLGDRAPNAADGPNRAYVRAEERGPRAPRGRPVRRARPSPGAALRSPLPPINRPPSGPSRSSSVGPLPTWRAVAQ